MAVSSDHNYADPVVTVCSPKNFIAIAGGQNSGIGTKEAALTWASGFLSKKLGETVTLAIVVAKVTFEQPPIKIEYL